MTQELILIADGQAARAEGVARAVEAAGRRTRIASQGAAALEAALSNPPRVAVVQADLPLLDAGKLAEILRANPRTRAIQLVVVGREPTRAAFAGVADEWLDEQSPVEAIVAAVARVVERQARLDALDLGAHEASALAGSLADLAPADLLQMLHVRRATGELTIQRGPAEKARVQLGGGEIRSVELGPAQGEKALFRLLGWREGEFRFEPGAGDETARMRLPTRTLLAEGRRQLEEWQRLEARLPALDTPIRMRVERSALPPVLHPLTQEVLAAIERSKCVGEVVDRASQPDYPILRTLQTLAERGIIELGRVRAASPDGFGPALFSEAQCRRLHGFVQAERKPDTPPPDAKLLIVSASPLASARFAELLEKVPGAELSPGVAGGADAGRKGTPRRVGPFGRVPVDAELAIDLIELSPDPAHAALWPFAAHRALGTIFLQDARVGESAPRLARVAAMLAEQPSARAFHVVLLGPGERVSPDEIRSNLALIESASLFLLPLDPGKEPSALLRSLFSRIVP